VQLIDDGVLVPEGIVRASGFLHDGSRLSLYEDARCVRVVVAYSFLRR
jgi:hypothetical protein